MTDTIVDWSSKPEPWYRIGPTFADEVKVELGIIARREAPIVPKKLSRLQELRASRGISQETLARAIGSTRVTVMRYEKSLRLSRGAAVLAKLAAFYGVSVEDIS